MADVEDEGKMCRDFRQTGLDKNLSIPQAKL